MDLSAARAWIRVAEDFQHHTMLLAYVYETSHLFDYVVSYRRFLCVAFARCRSVV